MRIGRLAALSLEKPRTFEAAGTQRGDPGERYTHYMASRAAPVAAVLASVLAFAPRASGAAGGPCSNDVFTIESNRVGIELCAEPQSAGRGKTGPGRLTATFRLRGQVPYVRRVPLDAVAGAETSRTIDDVPLARLGIAKTLHLTIVVKPGSVRLEHALLVPDAVPLK